MLKIMVRNKGFFYHKFYEKNIKPKLDATNLTEEEKEQAVETINNLILDDQLDEFLADNQEEI